MAKLRVHELYKKFQGNAATAVDHVSFSADEGEIISLLGPSGCGKTTTLRCIAGLEQPESGEIYLDERQLTRGPRHLVPPERRGMGMVFQSYSIWPHMTVGGNIGIGLRAKGLNRSEAERKIKEVLSLVRLPGLADRHATDLSGGQQQRVALARSLALEPKILLFDEPLSNLDANLREEMRLDLHDLLRRLKVTSIYVTHDQSEAFVLSNRILVMQRGKIVQVGRPEEIYHSPATRFIAEFVGSANVLTGQVRGMDGQLIVVELEDGQQLRASGSAAANEQVDLCVRSEAIVLEPRGAEPASSNALAGKISDCIYLGDRFEYRVAVGSNLLRADTRFSVRLDKGQLVWAKVAPSDALVLRHDRATGMAPSPEGALKPITAIVPG